MKFLGKVFIFGLVIVGLMGIFNFVPQKVEADTANVTLSTSVLEYLSLSITSGSTISFGNLTPGTPICSNTATVVSVTTNAANGYTIGLSDGSDTNSAMHKNSVYIPDYAGTIATPTSWSGVGLGIGLWAADTNKETKYGTGTTVCDTNNKYAGIPSTVTAAHTVTGYRSGADTSSWSWKIDVPNTQETGTYSGTVTFTATAVLS